MSKIKLADINKEINQRTGVLQTETARIKRNADILVQMLKAQEAQFVRQEEDERERKRLEQHQQMMQQQVKAWTMPDDEVHEQPEPVVVKKPEAPAVPVAEKAAPVAEPVAEPVVTPVVEAPVAKPAEPVKAAEPVVEAPAAAAPQPVAAPQAPVARPAAQATTAAPVARPAPSRPAPAAGPYGRPAPGAQQQAYGRPAPGPYGRPAPGAQQPYGRPASGPYGRPAPGAAQPGGRPGMPAPAGARPGMPARPGQRPARPVAAEPAASLEKPRSNHYDPNKKNYNRQQDPERASRNKRQARDTRFSGYDDDVMRGGKRRGRKPSAQQMMTPIKIEKAYMTAETITVKDLTERIGKPASEILKKLLLLGNLANINSELDFDTASLVATEFGVELKMKLAQTAEDVLSEADFEDDEEDLDSRAPVVTIMGHVDHGKTSLLDYIRSAHVTKTEAGGITQHIGAYTVSVSGQKITFLDTPGHEAFTAMRARGAQVTDIAILVVAADDGVMPQTVEAINHAKAAGVPIIIAINKMDKPTANPERIKQDLTAYNLVPEEWGGDIIMVPVSAHTGDGVETLLEMILLQAEVLQLRANPDRKARGVIIEAKLDRNRGPLATVLLQNGTLRVGDNIIAGTASGRVRAMVNDRGERVESAGPSTPVEIAGFDTVPQAGDEMVAVEDDKLSRQVAQERMEKAKEQRIAASSKVNLDNLFANIAEGKVETLNLIVKADVQGSVEAVRQAFEKLSTDQVKVRILHAGVGAVTQDDVNLASAFNAIIIGFNIRPDATARDMAARDGIDIRLYRVIYQAIEDIEKAMKGLLEPVFKEIILGHAEVRNVFKVTGHGTIAGSYVLDGKMQRNQPVRLLRDNVVVFEGKLSSLRRFKDDVREVAESYECGIGLENFNDIKERDVIECYQMQEVSE